MGEKRQISHVEEFQIIYIDTPPSGMMESINSSFLMCGPCTVTSFQSLQYGEQEKSKFTVEKTDTTSAR